MSLNTTPRTWVAGEVSTAANFNAEVRDAFTGIQSAWTTYTPAWTAATTNPAIGNGTLTGGYMQIGKTVHFWALMASGSTTTYGSGAYSMALPFTPGQTGVNCPPIFVRIKAGTNNYMGEIYTTTGTTAALAVYSGTAGGVLAAVSPTVPATFVSGSVITMSGTYEAA